MGKKPKAIVFYLGIGIFAAGLLLTHLLADAGGALQTFPFVLTGFGAGITGVGVVNLFRIRRLKNDPEKVRQYEISEKDERSVRIREKAGYATWYVTIFILAVLSMTFLVLDDDLACWLTLGALSIHCIVYFIYIGIYNKKM